MGIGAPGGMEIHRILQGSLSTISEETPSRKTPSSFALAALPDAAKDDVSYVFGNLAIQDVLPDNRDLVLKPWSKVDERNCGSLTGHYSRLFPRTEWYPLVDMGVKDTVAQCDTMQLPWTVQRAWHQMVVASRVTVRLLIYSAQHPSMLGAEAAATMSGRFVECDHVWRLHTIWRLHTRFGPNGADGSTIIPTAGSIAHVWLPSARLHLVAAAATQQPQALQAALEPPQLRLSKLSR
ncbi:uncharacterized protein [Dermacentor andersoni]|uniref:uncharacterized protein n=1 Tax=Dermacentor andersoni TaxID=34620 RepID=UPI002417460D|nr:uncharacterized protein LOC129381059 [Dermacentor andersoni]